MTNWVQLYYFCMLIAGAFFIGYGLGWQVGVGVGLVGYAVIPIHE